MESGADPYDPFQLEIFYDFMFVGEHQVSSFSLGGNKE